VFAKRGIQLGKNRLDFAVVSRKRPAAQLADTIF
jgi:hypothetical protein